MKYFKVCTKKEIENKVLWFKCGYIKELENGISYLTLFTYPETEFFIFEQDGECLPDIQIAQKPENKVLLTTDTCDKKVRNQSKRKRFIQADLELFGRELEKARGIENLLKEKAAIKYRNGNRDRVIVYCDDTDAYRKIFFQGYQLPGINNNTLRVPYSLWMELYHYYQNFSQRNNNVKN